MNMPAPIYKFAYKYTINSILHDSYSDTAPDSMKKAAAEAIPEETYVTSDDLKPVTARIHRT